jgi:hypothetical protein
LQFYNLEKSAINGGFWRPGSAAAERKQQQYEGQRRQRRVPEKPDFSKTDVHAPIPVVNEGASDAGSSTDELGSGTAEEEEEESRESGPLDGKRQSSYTYRPYVPNERTGENGQIDHTPILVQADALSIDPDFEQSLALEDAQKPKEITIPRYEDQFRILREAVVELRTNIQILKVKAEQPVVMSAPLVEEDKGKPDPDQVLSDETVIRVLRRKIESHHRDLEGQIQEVRRELYEYMAHPQVKLVEKQHIDVSRSHYETAREKRERARPEPNAPPVREFDVEMKIAKTKGFLDDEAEENRIMKIKAFHDLPGVDSMTKKPPRPLIVDTPLEGYSHPKADKRPRKVARPSSAGESKKFRWKLPANVPARPVSRSEKWDQTFQGREVPQVIQDMKVLNALPRDVILEKIMPYITEMKGEFQVQLDSIMERVRCLEITVPQKMDKEFVEAFFRKIKLTIHDMNERVVKMQSTMPDRALSNEELEDKIAEMMKTMPAYQETTIAGKTSYTCLLCGSKRAAGISGMNQIAKRGQVYKGRAAPPGATASYDPSLLPPLQSDDQ